MNENIVRLIIELGHNLNLKIVAEGVETYNQTQILSNYECDILQGYYFSKPVTDNEIENLLKHPINFISDRKPMAK